MCLAVPARIVELEDQRAVVDALGNRYDIAVTLTPDVAVGDIVLVHAGFAIAKVNEEDARQTWQLIAEYEEFEKSRNRLSG